MLGSYCFLLRLANYSITATTITVSLAKMSNRQQIYSLRVVSLRVFKVACFAYRSVILICNCGPIVVVSSSSTCAGFRLNHNKCRLCRMGNLTSSYAGGLSSTAYAQFVQDVVSHNCVVIFSKTTCPYCKMAKNIFNEIGATYKVVELDEHADGRQLQDTLGQMTGARTVPRVFINGQCIGGGSDAQQLHQQGKLLPLVEKCKPCCLSSASNGSESGQCPSIQS